MSREDVNMPELVEKGEWCCHHGREPIPDDVYIICGECWHCYATADDLAREYILNYPGKWDGPKPVPETITFCPLCLHDF